jgi:hypothetical protein
MCPYLAALQSEIAARPTLQQCGDLHGEFGSLLIESKLNRFRLSARRSRRRKSGATPAGCR